MGGWNGWHHVDGHTYGTWLPGDPRGWRDKHHRTHVEGDYRNPPPPGTGRRLHARARRLLKHASVHLSVPQWTVAGRAIVESLVGQGVETLVASMDAVHYHILARFADAEVRRRVGVAKLNAWHRLRERWTVKKVWQRLCNVTPIADRAHQVRVYRYVRDHSVRGAWVWTYKQGLYWRQQDDERDPSTDEPAASNSTPPGTDPGEA